jgi:GAF domain-containing protein
MDPSDIEPSGGSPDPRAPFAELSTIMLGAQPLSETLSRVAELAEQTIPGAAEVSGATISVDYIAHSGPYPDVGRIAFRHGFTHTMSIGLPVERRTVGALNVYGTGEGPFDETTAQLATAFASYAAVAVANAGLYATTATLAGNLQKALDSRAVIDQAKGILMGRHHCSADAAFDLLVRQSSTSNRRLRDIAQDIVDGVQRGAEA